MKSRKPLKPALLIVLVVLMLFLLASAFLRSTFRVIGPIMIEIRPSLREAALLQRERELERRRDDLEQRRTELEEYRAILMECRSELEYRESMSLQRELDQTGYRLIWIDDELLNVKRQLALVEFQIDSVMYRAQWNFATATPQLAGIGVLNTYSEVGADGSLENIVELSISPFSIGTVELIHPTVMNFGESAVVRLTIFPSSSEDLSRETPSLEIQDHTFSEEVSVYSRMQAELVGVNFVIVSDGYPEKPVTTSEPAEWIWNVTPRKCGEQVLVLLIRIPVIIDQTRDTRSVQPLRSIPIEISVLQEVPPVSPTPTSTPFPVSRRIGNQLVENSSSVLTAFLALLGTVLAAYATIQNSKRQSAAKKLEQQIAKDAEEKKELEQEIARLKSIPWWQFWRK